MRILALCAVMSLFLYPLSVLAEDPNEEIKVKEEVREELKLEEIVVTATRTEKEITEAPGSVSVVTKEDMEKRNIQTIDSAVNLLPGVFNKRAKGLDTTARVTLRGIPEQKRTLVLIDGQPMNDAYTGAVMWDSFLPENVERIEVVRGPYSALYGGYAMGGVVNIITKMPEEREFTVKSGYGSHDLWTTYGAYGDKLFDRLSLFASYGYKSSNGYPNNLVVRKPSSPGAGTIVTGWERTTDKYGNLAYLVGDKGDNSWWQDNGTLKLSFDFDDDTKASFSFMRRRYEYDYEDPHNYLRDATGRPVWSGNVNVDTGPQRIRLKEYYFLSGGGGRTQNIFNLGFQTDIFKNANLKVSVGLVDIEKNWYVSPSSTATRIGGPGKINETPSQAYQAELQLSFPIFQRHLITVGTGYRTSWANTAEHSLADWRDNGTKGALTYQSKGKDRTFSLYGQAEIVLRDNVTAYLGVRSDWWKCYDGMVNQVGTAGYPKYYESKSTFSVNPKIAVVYSPFEKTTLRGSFGRAFRPPTIYELYRTWVWWGTTYAGNPNLDPETVTSGEVGIEQGLWKGAVFKATYFHNWMKDLIYRRDVTPKLKEYINAGEAESSGVELEIEQKFDKWVRLFANFTYTHSEIEENLAKPTTEGKRLTMVPEKMFNIGGELTYGPLSLSLTGRYVSKQYNNDENLDKEDHVFGSYDPYFVADADVSFDVTKWAKLYFSVDNIFDEDYFTYYKAPGRTFFGGLTLRF